MYCGWACGLVILFLSTSVSFARVPHSGLSAFLSAVPKKVRLTFGPRVAAFEPGFGNAWFMERFGISGERAVADQLGTLPAMEADWLLNRLLLADDTEAVLRALGRDGNTLRPVEGNPLGRFLEFDRAEGGLFFRGVNPRHEAVGVYPELTARGRFFSNGSIYIRPGRGSPDARAVVGSRDFVIDWETSFGGTSYRTTQFASTMDYSFGAGGLAAVGSRFRPRSIIFDAVWASEKGSVRLLENQSEILRLRRGFSLTAPGVQKVVSFVETPNREVVALVQSMDTSFQLVKWQIPQVFHGEVAAAEFMPLSTSMFADGAVITGIRFSSRVGRDGASLIELSFGHPTVPEHSIVFFRAKDLTPAIPAGF